MWSYGCILAFMGTGAPPYDEQVHERAARIAHDPACPSPLAATYALIEWAAQEGHTPLERLRHATPACPAEIDALAEQCVQPRPTARLKAVEVLAQLPRETGLFADDHGGHARRARIGDTSIASQRRRAINHAARCKCVTPRGAGPDTRSTGAAVLHKPIAMPPADAATARRCA